MDAAETQLAIEQIRQVKGRYFRFMDTRDRAGLRTVFCDDATFDARASLSLDGAGDSGRAAESNDWGYRGGDEITAFVQAAIGSQRSCHHGHCHEIEILSHSEARGVIAMEDRVWDGDTLALHGMGHCHETYRKVDGAWRGASTRRA